MFIVFMWKILIYFSGMFISYYLSVTADYLVVIHMTYYSDFVYLFSKFLHCKRQRNEMSNVCIKIRTQSVSLFTYLLVINDIRHFSLL